MGIRRYRPNNAGRRNMSVSDFAELTKGAKPVKSLLRPKKRCSGRNNQGIITVRHRGGGAKRHIRLVDFRRNKDGMVATVDSIQYDPNRSARIALLVYEDGTKRYIVAPEGLTVGAKVVSGATAEPRLGNCLPLSKIPLGAEIHNIELRPGRGGCMCRSAGTKAVLVAREEDWARKSTCSVQLPRGRRRRRKRRSHEHRARKSRSCSLDGTSSLCPRHRDEPDRPPARGRRGSYQGRSSSCHAYRQADQGHLDA